MRKGIVAICFLLFCPTLLAQMPLDNSSVIKMLKAGPFTGFDYFNYQCVSGLLQHVGGGFNCIEESRRKRQIGRSNCGQE